MKRHRARRQKYFEGQRIRNKRYGSKQHITQQWAFFNAWSWNTFWWSRRRRGDVLLKIVNYWPGTTSRWRSEHQVQSAQSHYMLWPHISEKDSYLLPLDSFLCRTKLRAHWSRLIRSSRRVLFRCGHEQLTVSRSGCLKFVSEETLFWKIEQ